MVGVVVLLFQTTLLLAYGIDHDRDVHGLTPTRTHHCTEASQSNNALHAVRFVCVTGSASRVHIADTVPG